MKFYTYVTKIGNRIYRREIDNKGERYSGYTHFKPTLYLPAPEDAFDPGTPRDAEQDTCWQ